MSLDATVALCDNPLIDLGIVPVGDRRERPATTERPYGGRMERQMTTPSSKQIAYILRLCNGRHDSDADREMAADMGCSVSAARRRATSADASRTIDRLLRASGQAPRTPRDPADFADR